ncbi:MAG: SAM-dependent methyltransferase [Alphaproteobacteria bacterium]|nr:SAM-dependent methyltransferase [Alphaproteobacteria bacterium]
MRGLIRAAGPLSIERYMEIALWHPAWGYYATHRPVGARGDFITAPEISQVFGELIGLWLADAWQRLGAPDPVVLCELGPGNGTLMADLLRAAAVVPPFRRAIRVHLVEASAALREAQGRVLAAATPAWHDSVATLPPGPLLLVANEFLDALPIRQFERGPDGWRERRIGLDAGGALTLVGDSAPTSESLPDWPVGSVVERRPTARMLARDLGRRLATQGGAALFVDYGYFPPAPGDTLQAVARHRGHDPLRDPGTADLTAHVDFADFAAAATAAGVRAWGPVTQARFLAALGIDIRARRLAAGKDAAEQATIESGCRRLLDETQMGTLFKALALTGGAASPPAGFD